MTLCIQAWRVRYQPRFEPYFAVFVHSDTVQGELRPPLFDERFLGAQLSTFKVFQRPAMFAGYAVYIVYRYTRIQYGDAFGNIRSMGGLLCILLN